MHQHADVELQGQGTRRHACLHRRLYMDQVGASITTSHTKEERLGAVAQACNPSTWEVNVGESGVQA